MPETTASAAPADELRTLSVASIAAASERNPRTDCDPEALDRLADSIRRHGVLQPLVVEPDPEGEGFLLIAGGRRLQAARAAGLVEVPALVRTGVNGETATLALIENLQRADLSPVEEARAFARLIREGRLSLDPPF